MNKSIYCNYYARRSSCTPISLCSSDFVTNKKISMVGLFKSPSSPICSSPRVYCSSERAIIFFFFSLFLSLRRLARWCTLHLLFQAFNSATFDSLTHFFLNISYHSIKLSPNELSWDCNSPQAIAAEKFSLFCACYLLFPRRVTNIRASYFRVRVHVFTVGDSADEFPRKAGSSSIFLV